MKAISLDSLSGFVAMWATRQSPYRAPDGLTDVLLKFRQQALTFRLPDFPDDWPILKASRVNLVSCLDKCLFTIPQVMAWNDRKNGRQSPLGFLSRYDKPNPDDDFIDLDALKNNIVRSCLGLDECPHFEVNEPEIEIPAPTPAPVSP